MARRSTKKFEFGKGIYYFNINKGYNNCITIKRMERKKALQDYASYLKLYNEKCEWLGKWNGSNFIEDNYESLLKKEGI